MQKLQQIKNKITDLNTLNEILNGISQGKIRAVNKINGEYVVNELVKIAILSAFEIFPLKVGLYDSYDKFELLPASTKYRRAPGAIVRNYVYIGEDAVIMPSCINIGAYIGKKSMIDMNAVIGSCAQIGENCHISAHACIGGVLEPIESMPVVVEDNCFIGAHSAILEGVLIESNSVIAAGAVLSGSTRIINRETGEEFYGKVPSGSVVVPGSYRSKNGININCAVIIRTLKSNTRHKLSINEILRNK